MELTSDVTFSPLLLVSSLIPIRQDPVRPSSSVTNWTNEVRSWCTLLSVVVLPLKRPLLCTTYKLVEYVVKQVCASIRLRIALPNVGIFVPTFIRHVQTPEFRLGVLHLFEMQVRGP